MILTFVLAIVLQQAGWAAYPSVVINLWSWSVSLTL